MKKSMILVFVLGVALALTVLALVALNLMTQESRVAEHKIRRIRAFYATEAAKIDALERLRRNITPAGAPNVTSPSGVFPPAAGAAFSYTLNGIGSGVAGYPNNGYSVTVTIRGRSLVNATDCPNSEPSDFCVEASVGY